PSRLVRSRTWTRRSWYHRQNLVPAARRAADAVAAAGTVHHASRACVVASASRPGGASPVTEMMNHPVATEAGDRSGDCALILSSPTQGNRTVPTMRCRPCPDGFSLDRSLATPSLIGVPRPSQGRYGWDRPDWHGLARKSSTTSG